MAEKEKYDKQAREQQEIRDVSLINGSICMAWQCYE